MALEAIATGFAANVASAGVLKFVEYLAERIGLLNAGKLNLEDAAETLKQAAEELLVKKKDYDGIVQQNKTRTKTTSNCYNLWVVRVTNIIPDLENLQIKCTQEENLFQEGGIRREVTTILQRVGKLLEDGKFPNGILVDKPPERVIKLPSVPEIKEFETQRGHLEEILKLLNCQRIYTIVIWGPLGVGKTTIMQNLNNHEKVAKMFDIVIWIEVKELQDEELQEELQEKLQKKLQKKLQEKIAKRLNPNWQGAVEDIAESIREELMKKKFLLLLDNFVECINLHDIGIPGYKNDSKKDSKVVLTAERAHVCCKMELDREIEVNMLNADEAWRMFKGMVKDRFNVPRVEEVAVEVAEECCRLPLLIKIVAESFQRKRELYEWRDGLEDLRKWREAFEIPGFKEVHAFFKFCYDSLTDQKTKICFLYGALHPTDTKISSDYLVKCWAAERFLGNIDDNRSLRTACDKGHVILKHLTEVSLLKAGERLEHVKVCKMVREVARHISSEDPNCKFLIREDKSAGEQATRIFMIDAGLQDLSDLPECSMVLSLLLQKNPGFKVSPLSFFTKMKKLQVLNLYKTGIESLPSPFFEWLTGLKALFLNKCTNLTRLSLQIEQHHLEVLDIRDCCLIFMPSFIGQLINLRCLRVSYYKQTKTGELEEIMIADNVISKLSKLEELVIDVISYDQWCDEVINVIQQVASLTKLTSLKLYFPNIKVLGTLMELKPEWQRGQQLSVFWFFVGKNSNRPKILDHFSSQVYGYLRYEYDGCDHDYPNVFPVTDALELIGHEKITCLSEFIKAQGLNGVRACLVEGCNNMETVLDGNNAGGTDILPYLELLHLSHLIHLESIFKGPLSEGRLSKLQTIVVNECMTLTEIGMIQQLPSLKKLTINRCYRVKKLIEHTEGNGSMHNLEVLELYYLTGLSTICTNESLVWPHLKEFRVYECSELKGLPFDRDRAKELKMIQGEEAWWDSLEWVNDEAREHFSFSPFAL